jgi:hypothetical protein
MSNFPIKKENPAVPHPPDFLKVTMYPSHKVPSQSNTNIMSYVLFLEGSVNLYVHRYRYQPDLNPHKSGGAMSEDKGAYENRRNWAACFAREKNRRLDGGFYWLHGPSGDGPKVLGERV